MYAVINDRGKQYTVKAGDRLRIDRLDLEPGTEVIFDRILLNRQQTPRTKVIVLDPRKLQLEPAPVVPNWKIHSW